MAQRIGGIQDITLTGVSICGDARSARVAMKIPYITLGFSKQEDFWTVFQDIAKSFNSTLEIFKELLQKNAPYLEDILHKELGGQEVLWKWLVSPIEDTRHYAITKCTPDLVYFVTVAEVK